MAGVIGLSEVTETAEITGTIGISEITGLSGVTGTIRVSEITGLSELTGLIGTTGVLKVTGYSKGGSLIELIKPRVGSSTKTGYWSFPDRFYKKELGQVYGDYW